jgi:hypothetical protein
VDEALVNSGLPRFDVILDLHYASTDALMNGALHVHVQRLAGRFLIKNYGPSNCGRDCLFVERITVFVGHGCGLSMIQLTGT